MIKGADEIFPLRDINAGFAAHRAVHLGQQGGWHPNKRNTALIGGGEKTGEIACDTTPQSDQCVMTVKTPAGQPAGKIAQGLQIFARFPMGKNKQFCLYPCTLQHLQQHFPVKTGNIAVGDHRITPAKGIF